MKHEARNMKHERPRELKGKLSKMSTKTSKANVVVINYKYSCQEWTLLKVILYRLGWNLVSNK